ncbi:hypothetical protein C8F01DRAFT_1083751 [Mycena amicta]|nr:hypothetical protein C8F01DRAFT_1083751 [Mycena amicta]
MNQTATPGLSYLRRVGSQRPKTISERQGPPLTFKHYSNGVSNDVTRAPHFSGCSLPLRIPQLQSSPIPNETDDYVSMADSLGRAEAVLFNGFISFWVILNDAGSAFLSSGSHPHSTVRDFVIRVTGSYTPTVQAAPFFLHPTIPLAIASRWYSYIIFREPDPLPLRYKYGLQFVCAYNASISYLFYFGSRSSLGCLRQHFVSPLIWTIELASFIFAGVRVASSTLIETLRACTLLSPIASAVFDASVKAAIMSLVIRDCTEKKRGAVGGRRCRAYGYPSSIPGLALHCALGWIMPMMDIPLQDAERTDTRPQACQDSPYCALDWLCDSWILLEVYPLGAGAVMVIRGVGHLSAFGLLGVCCTTWTDEGRHPEGHWEFGLTSSREHSACNTTRDGTILTTWSSCWFGRRVRGAIVLQGQLGGSGGNFSFHGLCACVTLMVTHRILLAFSSHGLILSFSTRTTLQLDPLKSLSTCKLLCASLPRHIHMCIKTPVSGGALVSADTYLAWRPYCSGLPTNLPSTSPDAR